MAVIMIGMDDMALCPECNICDGKQLLAWHLGHHHGWDKSEIAQWLEELQK